VDLLVGDVIAPADHLGGKWFSIASHDWGGFIAWLLAAHHPDRAITLTSISTPHPRAMASVGLRSAQLLRSLHAPFFGLPVVPEWVLLAGHGAVLFAVLRRSGLDAELASSYVAAMRSPGAMAPALSWYGAARPGQLARTAPVPAPTLHIWGARDPAVGRSRHRGVRPLRQRPVPP
jgi:pimeloyl-ACP methyl ester carboxylesterase